MSRSRKILYICFVTYFSIILIIAVLPPIVELWNRLEPHVFSFPFSQATVICISIALITGLFLWFILEERLNKLELKLRNKESLNDN